MAERDGRTEKDGKVYFTCDGVTYEVPPFDFDADLVDLQTFYKQHKKMPVDALNDVAEQLALARPAIREALLDRAFAVINQGPGVQSVTRTELLLWLDTTEGTVYQLYLSLRKKYPDMTVSKARQILARAGKAEIEKVIERASRHTEAMQLRDAAEKAGVLHEIIADVKG